MQINESLAPIVLFVYNRPDHTRQTLMALKANDLASESRLIIYADGPKPGATEEELNRIHEVRTLIREREWCGSNELVERDANFGLARNIVEGVTEVVSCFGRIIVLEDDIVTSPGFLKYMNEALTLYGDEDRVMHISGYWFPVKGHEKLPDTFFYNTTSCWGWGTWKRAWDLLNLNSLNLKKRIIEKDPDFRRFTINGTADFLNQLDDNINGKIRTWAVKWYASMFLQNGLALHPNHSLVNNIGHDNSGANCRTNNRYNWNKLADNVPVKRIPLQESLKARRMMMLFYQSRKQWLDRIKQALNKNCPPELLQFIKRKYKPPYPRSFRHLKTLPRYTETTVIFQNINIRIPDSASFLFMFNEIFNEEIYRFESTRESPYIIDGGANIGLSIIYFKLLYPKAQIVAFEPDPYIHGILSENIRSFGIDGVDFVQKGLWNGEGTMVFQSEGADGGQLVFTQKEQIDSELQTDTVEVTSLRPYLNREVDLLKLDIEGAEDTVIRDIKGHLQNVKRLFIEYHSFVDRPQKLAEILTSLDDAGFRMHISSPGLTNRQPFVERKLYNGMDMQLNIYAYK